LRGQDGGKGNALGNLEDREIDQGLISEEHPAVWKGERKSLRKKRTKVKTGKQERERT